MNVVLVIATLEAGGAERVLSILANNWAKKNDVKVEIILLSGGTLFYKIDSRIKLTQFGFKTNKNGLAKIVSLCSMFFRFRRYLKKKRPDFVLSFMTKNNIFTILSLFRLKIATIVSERESPTEKVPKIRSFLRDRTYAYADGIICQTELSKKFIKHKTGSKNIISIPNPIKEVVSNNTLNREKIILNVGRLVHKKGQKYLIEAFSKVNAKDWKLVFLGDGQLKQELYKYSSELDLNDRILFNGTTKDVDSWYQKSAIFAFPSILEGYPNALAEAMCNGMACVSFDCNTGPKDIIIDGTNGYLVEERNVVQFVEKLQLLINNEDLRTSFSKEAFKLNKILNEDLIAERYYNFCVSGHHGMKEQSILEND